MEEHGVPIDTTALMTLREQWSAIQEGLITKVDADYGVYEGQTFKRDRFAAWLAARGGQRPSGCLGYPPVAGWRATFRL